MSPLGRLRTTWLLGAGAAVLLSASWPSAIACAADKPTPPLTRLSDAELLLLEVSLDRHVLSRDLSAYQHGADVFVPLGELSRLLGIAVTSDPETGLAEGYVLQESRGFRLDARSGEALVAGQRVACDPARLVVKDDDIYVASSLVERLFPLALALDANAAEVAVTPREVLPLQQFLEREGRAKMGGATTAAHFPTWEAPYRLFDWPTLDQGLSLSMTQDSTGRPLPSGRYSTFATGELLFMSGDLFMTGSEQFPISDFRASLGRKDPDAGLLGPLRATEAAAGQLAMPGLSLLARPQPGLGVTLSNFPLNQASQFDHHNFQGNLAPGWDVELYRGEQLLGHQASRPDGRYLFEQVPLLMGLNNFRLVFYGPQGQRREESYPFNVGDSLTPAGTQRYRATASMQPDGAPASYFQYDMGLLPQLSATLGLATLSTDGVRTQAAKVGARGFWGAYFLSGDLGLSSDGLLGQASAQTTLGPVNVTLQHARTSGAAAQGLAVGANVLGHSEARLDWPSVGVWDAALSTGVSLSIDELHGGGSLGRFSLPVTLAYHDLYAAHRMNFSVGEGGAPGYFSDAALQLSGRWDVWGLRGEVGYNAQGLRSLSLVGSARRWWLDYNLNLGVSRGLPNGDTSFVVNVSRDLGVCLMGMDANSQSVSMNLSSGMSFDPTQGALSPRSAPQAGTGAMVARVFLDMNRNGRWDAGEAPLEGVGVGQEGNEPTLTNALGLATLRSLASYTPLDVAIAPDTLSDPLWMAVRPGVRVVPRPGRTVTVDFPIVPTGEVNGTIYLKRGRKASELGGATLELLSDDDRVVATTRTAYDGFYTFSTVAPGHYRLRLPSEQFVKRNIVPLPPQDLTIAPSGTLVEGLDLTLEFAHDAVPPPKTPRPKPHAPLKPGAHAKPGVAARPDRSHAAPLADRRRAAVRKSRPVRPVVRVMRQPLPTVDAGLHPHEVVRRRVAERPLPSGYDVHVLDTDALEPLEEVRGVAAPDDAGAGAWDVGPTVEPGAGGR